MQSSTGQSDLDFVTTFRELLLEFFELEKKISELNENTSEADVLRVRCAEVRSQIAQRSHRAVRLADEKEVDLGLMIYPPPILQGILPTISTNVFEAVLQSQHWRPEYGKMDSQMVLDTVDKLIGVCREHSQRSEQMREMPRQTSTAPLPSTGKRYEVFISSTYQDLKDERQKALQAVLECDCFPSGMELFPAAIDHAWTYITRMIDSCDCYIVIVGGRYGSLVPDQRIGYTEKECRYALENGKSVLAFLHKNPGSILSEKTEYNSQSRDKLKTFREFLETTRMVPYWDSPENLRSEVLRSLRKLIEDYPMSGWVKATAVSEATVPELAIHLTLKTDDQKLRERITGLVEGITKKPRDRNLLYEMGQLCRHQLYDYGLAIWWYLMCAERSARDSSSYDRIAEMFQKDVGDTGVALEQAVKWYEISAEADPDNSWPCDELGKLYKDRGQNGDLDRAIDWFEESVKRRPSGNSIPYDRIAEIHRDEYGDCEEAIRWFAKSATVDASNSFPCIEIAKLCQNQLNDKVKAIEWYEKALQRDHKNGWVEDQLRQLKSTTDT